MGTAQDAGPGDARPDAPSGPFPAFAVDSHTVVKNQGEVLAHPVMVTVSWPDDANASTWEAFGDGIGASAYWAATTAEYGVGPGVSGAANHVRVTQALPQTISDIGLADVLTAALTTAAADAGDGGPTGSAWPLPTVDASGHSQTVYSLFVPASTTLLPGVATTCACGQPCDAYHSFATVDGVVVPYAVILECAGDAATTVEQKAARELVGAATDPVYRLGYVGFDADHDAWELMTAYTDDIGEACQDWQSSYDVQSGAFPFGIQRTWSNAAAQAGHDPCVPAAPGAYHGMTLFPSQEESVTVDLSTAGPGSITTRGFNVTVGTPFTFQLGFFSDGPTAPWEIDDQFPDTIDLGEAHFDNGAATIQLDKHAGQNGDMVNVTVTVSEAGSAGFNLLAITWDAPASTSTRPHYLPILLVDH